MTLKVLIWCQGEQKEGLLSASCLPNAYSFSNGFHVPGEFLALQDDDLHTKNRWLSSMYHIHWQARGGNE